MINTVSATRIPMTIADGTALVGRWHVSGQRPCDFSAAESIVSVRILKNPGFIGHKSIGLQGRAMGTRQDPESWDRWTSDRGETHPTQL